MVAEIEQAANEAFRLDPPGKGVNKKINGAPRNALLKPSDAEQRLSHQRFSLGDRIVYVQDSGRVPIATRGTVVGKTRTSRTTLLDVVFDVTFMSGTSLEDRCSPFRGSTVPIHSVLNLTERQVIAGSRAGANNRSQTKTPLTVAGYGSPLGPNGQGQLLPAQVPAPLRGSFRGAVSGQTNGMRGGGSPRGRGGLGYDPQDPQTLPIRTQQSSQTNGFRGRGGQPNGAPSRGRGDTPRGTRQGYTKIDLGNDDGVVQNNPSFQLRSYNNAPPPADLDTRGRGRGQGGSRGGGPSRGVVPRGRRVPRGKGTAVVVPQQ